MASTGTTSDSELASGMPPVTPNGGSITHEAKPTGPETELRTADHSEERRLPDREGGRIPVRQPMARFRKRNVCVVIILGSAEASGSRHLGLTSSHEGSAGSGGLDARWPTPLA